MSPGESIVEAIRGFDTAGLLSFPIEVLDQNALGSEWTQLSHLIDDDDQTLGSRIGIIEDARKGSRDVAALLLLGNLARSITDLPIAAFMARQQTPALQPDRIWIKWNELGQCAALGYDQNAELHETSNCQTLANTLQPVMQALVHAVRRQARGGQRALWSGVATAVAASFLAAGRQLGQQQSARTTADALFALAGHSWDVRPEWFVVSFEDAEHVFLRRKVCCLAYKLPNSAYCTSCPLMNDNERRDTLIQLLATRRGDN